MAHHFDIYHQLILLMMRSKRGMFLLCEKRNLTPAQAMFLMKLDANRPYSMNEISESIGCDASNTTGLVDRLDVQGLIDRTTDKNDRRIKIVRLNSKGEKLRTQILKDLKQAELLDLEKLSDSEVKSLIQIIKKLTS